jgi:hypothetical protein
LGDLALAIGFSPQARVMPPKQTGELCLPARTVLAVVRIADGPQVGGGRSAYAAAFNLFFSARRKPNSGQSCRKALS